MSWVAAILLGGVVLIGVGTGGIGGMLITVGLIALITGIYALVTGRRTWCTWAVARSRRSSSRLALS